ncbi:MAG: gliding motility-associated C-terminal domain-containing protein [Saprospiraceae bacterium]|nr:gliding motility-associated C-terminal domain-containing protein [Saprospiraceae bacterium]MCF8249794.1 gliding motility-associated C-terminal domain-containing protein [Saprospiraceae bacterium]MCF8279279.1 gliding motility-associated C-terminal domain-containing protein [Bacteroidales bacterium]MCF8313455.1 gliding motility-associated C-terminal domain-containing protein [Saprospiraceae bacterium]MCF8442168.1 gliding motility-associated C-terminal domain-containing protein [Saprospiraceae 
MKRIFTFRKKITFLLLVFLSLPGLLSACDTSGYLMNGITDNGDGTFTIDWTALVAGGTTTGVGSTWGFYLNIDATILSISPSSFTSANGTTLNAVINGGNVQWGNPAPGSGPVFLDINTQPNDESFPFTMVVSGIPTAWDGGGQEANQCPGGPGSGDTYEGVFPCFEPTLTPAPAEVHICPGGTAVLTVVPNHLVEDILWQPGGQTTPSITVTLNQTETFTIIGSNAGCDFSTTITVIVDPFPMLTPEDPNIEVCEGTPATLIVNTEFTDYVTWSPGGGSGPINVVVPTTSPTTYTATGFNYCGPTSINFTVTTIPFPVVNASNDKFICQGESVTLTANATGTNTITWLPTGQSGNSITVSPTVTTTYYAVVSNFCGTDTADVVVTVSGNTTNNIQLYACQGKTVMYNGIPLAAGSNSTFTFTNSNGCDSVVQVNVQSLPNSTGTLNLKACQGQTASFMGQNLAIGSSTQFHLTSANGCDSLLTVNVTGKPVFNSNLTLKACVGDSVSYNGQMLPAGATQNFVLTAANGCDSTVHVTVQTLPNYASNKALKTCTGTTVTYAGTQLQPNTVTPFTLTAFNGCDSVVTVTVTELPVLTDTLNFQACPGTSIGYNGQQLQPNTSTDFTFTTAAGCDSIMTVNVSEVAAFQQNLSFDACTGMTVSYNGQTLQPGSVTDFTFTTAAGCDSIVTVTVVELLTYASDLTVPTCQGIPISYAGMTLQPGSVTPVVLASQNGCDSTVTVTVEEILVPPTSVNLSACQGGTAFYFGQNLQPGSVTDFTYTSFFGCDSLVTVTVAALQTYTDSLVLETCQGNTVTYNGTALPPGTDLNFTFTATNGCDSVVNVVVNEVQGYQTSLALTTCPGTTANYNGQALAPGSVTQFDFVASQGCDSTVTVTVTALQAFSSSLTLTTCPGSTATYNGQTLAAGTMTPFVLTAQNGCDSTVTVTVVASPPLFSNLVLTACPGSTATYNGQQLALGSITPFVLTAQNGCDSTVTVTVQALQTSSSSLSLTACTGSTATYNGQQLQPGSVTPFVFAAQNGCDSTVTVTVVELLPQSSALNLQACTGSTVTYNGQTLQPGSTTDVTLDTWQGCDSVVTVTVQELAVLTGAVTLQGCAGEPLIYNGTSLQPGTSQNFTFASQNGCDSIVTVTALPSIPTASTSEQIQICEGGTATIFGQPATAEGDYSQTFTGSNGCDSTHTVTLVFVNNVSVSFANGLSIRLGESVVLNPTVNPPSGLTYAWLEDPTLSCLDCRKPTASPLAQTTYTLTVTDFGGCTASASVVVEVGKGKVYIPNSFSPNDDGINDVFMVFSDGRSVKEIHSFIVFSRWGESLYEIYHSQPDAIEYGWDGTHRGEKLDVSVFIYLADIEFKDGTRQLYKGDVTIVR